MKIAEAYAVVREQTIPALKGSGGDLHAEALSILLAEIDALRKTVDDLHLSLHILKAQAKEH